MEDALTDPEVNPEILGWFESKAFASVPLVAKGRSIGLIAVDNRFTERPITSTDIGFLNLLSNQAALAIENSRLYSNLQEINTQLLNTQNRLIQSEKLAALGEVVASIAHEIKNPLVSIGGFVRRMERNLQDNSSEKKYMRIVLKEVNRLENVLNETLAYSKEIPPPSRAQDINRIIEDSLSILEGEIQERNISVSKELDPNFPPLPSEPEQIKQVFLNLFVNAIQAMGSDGHLSVKTWVKKEEKREFLQIEVGDTGGGIAQENLDNIFNPFFTTKQNGTGLGLAITHKIITRYGGEIEVINRPGAGATFVDSISPAAVKSFRFNRFSWITVPYECHSRRSMRIHIFNPLSRFPLWKMTFLWLPSWLSCQIVIRPSWSEELVRNLKKAGCRDVSWESYSGHERITLAIDRTLRFSARASARHERFVLTRNRNLFS